VTRVAWLLAAPALWGAYTWGSHLLAPACVWRGRRDERAVALTFDDGPDPEHTPAVLDVLAREGVQATFFLIGRRAERAPELVRRMVAEGHDLGNHTLSHRSLWGLGPRETTREMRGGHEAIAQAAGGAPSFFRPPWGKTNLAMFPALKALGTPCVFWTIQPEGRRPVSPQAQLRRAAARVRPGAIFDLHDADGVPGAGGRLRAALAPLIGGLRGAGYRLVPLRDLL
jgi:peptidoglycan/xylan/chitin deacetylase (PgdA/CDA1 family)